MFFGLPKIIFQKDFVSLFPNLVDISKWRKKYLLGTKDGGVER